MKKLLLLLVPLVLFSSCKTTSLLLAEKYTEPLVLPVEQLCSEETVWTDINVENLPEHSFQLTENTVKSINSHWKCIKIDLDTPGLSIVAEPYKENLGKRTTPKKFSARKNTIAAINTVPFDLDGRTYIPVSVVKIDNQLICDVNQNYCVLGFYSENGKLRAAIDNNQEADKIQNYEYAFGGFYTILEGDTIYQFEKYKRSRSAVGISDNGRFLYLFAGCGINCPTGRNGFNFEECALILQKLGCTKAMEFDGGHSTGLTLFEKNAVRPSLQRKVPALFGIKTNE